MTIIDQYFSTCNDCGNRWESYVGVSTNTFGMTAKEAESHLKHFASHQCSLVPNLVPIFEQDAGDC